jgi:hypothetical protein
LPPGLFFNIGKNSVGLGNLFLRFGFEYFAQPKAQTIEHLGHRTGRGPLLLAIALGAQGGQRRLGCQPCIGQRRTKGRGVLRMGFGQPLQRFSGLWVLLFPTFTATEGRLRTETPDTRASLGQPHGKSTPPPTEERFGQ